MIALSEYIGETQVNTALRRMIEASRSRREGDPLQTTLDLYRELQAVTPDSLQSLLRDLVELNTIWEFDTKSGTAKQTEAGAWQVTLDGLCTAPRRSPVAGMMMCGQLSIRVS